MVNNMENFQRENEKLKIELSQLNIRCEVAEVTIDLLSKSVNIAESSNVLEAENHTLRKEIAGLRNGDPEIGMPPQRSMEEKKHFASSTLFIPQCKEKDEL
ncbi:hypothetical protein EV1_014821 [Malus domestica]